MISASNAEGTTIQSTIIIIIIIIISSSSSSSSSSSIVIIRTFNVFPTACRKEITHDTSAKLIYNHHRDF